MVQHSDQTSCDGHAVGAVEQVLAVALHAYICADADGRVLAWNPAAEAVFGYSREQACGSSVEELIVPAQYRSAHRAGLFRVAAGGPGRVLGHRLQLTAQHADGHEFPVELALTVTNDADGRRFHAFAHDVTTTVRAQRFAAVEAAVSRGLADAAGSAPAAEAVVQALGVGLGWPVIEMWLVDDARRVLVCAGRHTSRDVADLCLPELEYGIGLPGRVHETGRPQWISDLGADSASVRSRLAARYGLRVAVGVPIRSGATVLGALTVYGEDAEDQDDSLTSLLAGIAVHTGQYLERRRAEELRVELARTKDEFLAMVTHELRNPLSIITGTAALFDDELDELSPAQQRQYLNIIIRNAERLAAMAGDLLDLARLEAGHLGIDPVDCDLADVIGQAVQAAAPAAASKQVSLIVDLDDRLDLHADPDRLRQVADNLLGNAIKYTPAEGRITVAAGPAADDTIVWTVTDTGIGIPAADRPRLFRRFYRASTALQHRIPGTGLGLVVTRAIVERHHGTITLADRPGPGTTFVITLPVKPPA
jgi:PAS domain S-box-containing protein